jgi:hypothetical protein
MRPPSNEGGWGRAGSAARLAAALAQGHSLNLAPPGPTEVPSGGQAPSRARLAAHQPLCCRCTPHLEAQHPKTLYPCPALTSPSSPLLSQLDAPTRSLTIDP